MPHKLILRGRFWHYAGTVAGRRFRGTTGTTDKALAQRIAAEAEAREWRRHLDGTEAVATMAQAMIAYLDADKPTRFLGKIADHWKETRLKEVTAEAVRMSAKKLYPDANPATWNRQVIVPTAAVINYAAELGWCQKISVKRFPVDPKSKEPVTLEWVTAFAAQAAGDRLPQMAALCMFMFATGSRIGQACDLTWNSVDLNKATVILYTEKPTPWTRKAHLPPPVVAALANIPGDRKGDDLVFGYADRGSVTKTWANIIKRAGIARLTPHSCRHGMATAMMHKGFDLKTIAARGGWRDAATLLRVYAHAMADTTVTDGLFDTNLAQTEASDPATTESERKNSA